MGSLTWTDAHIYAYTLSDVDIDSCMCTAMCKYVLKVLSLCTHQSPLPPGYGVYRLIYVSTARDRKQKDKRRQKEAKKKK